MFGLSHFITASDIGYVNGAGNTAFTHSVMSRCWRDSLDLLKLGSDYERPIQHGFHTQTGKSFKGLTPLQCLESYAGYLNGTEEALRLKLIDLIKQKQQRRELAMLLTRSPCCLPRDLVDEIVKCL